MKRVVLHVHLLLHHLVLPPCLFFSGEAVYHCNAVLWIQGLSFTDMVICLYGRSIGKLPN